MKKPCKTYRRKISETVKYDELDMENLSRSATARMSEDDGPHTSKLKGDENKHFTTVADPTSVINQPNSLGNVDGKFNLASRQTGKPFKALRKQMKYSGGEDFTGAVAKVGIGESALTENPAVIAGAGRALTYVPRIAKTVGSAALRLLNNRPFNLVTIGQMAYDVAKAFPPPAVRKPADVLNVQPNQQGPFARLNNIGANPQGPFARLKKRVNEAKDKGEYDYEGDMAKSQLRSIIYNARMLHDMLKDDTNLPEWVQSKITLAEDYVVTAAQYMNSSVKEEVEQIDELNRETLASYIKKASPSYKKLVQDNGRFSRQALKRSRGITRAATQILKKDMPHLTFLPSKVHEKVEQVNELEDKTMQSALLKRAGRLVDAERDTTLSPQNKKIVTAFHRQRMAKIARHIQTHKYPAMRELMKKYGRSV